MAFEKGHRKIGGRKKGTRNKAYLSLTFWFELVANNIDEMTDKERVAIAFQAINVLAPKVTNLPADPQDSVNNAFVKEAMMNALENGPKPVENNDNPHT